MRNALTAQETEILNQLCTEIQKRKKESRELNKDKQAVSAPVSRPVLSLLFYAD